MNTEDYVICVLRKNTRHNRTRSDLGTCSMSYFMLLFVLFVNSERVGYSYHNLRCRILIKEKGAKSYEGISYSEVILIF